MSNNQQRTWDPHITVATIVPEPITLTDLETKAVLNTQRYLFIEEQIENDIITNQPSGHLEAHESFFDAAVRETLEETGWHVELTHFIGVYVYTPPFSKEGSATTPTARPTFFRFCFSAKPVDQIATVEHDHGIIRPLWLTLEELNAKDRKLRTPLVKQCLIDYQGGKRYPLSTITEWIE